ncbi:MAG TPA: DivIVA domain-containing protein [Caldisericia bacterium]|jgi:cell division initiation protein|nr:DivIVA domain-containing protein [Caldisericia bacterium]HNY61796.1 DivIVA domain-containing protein [Caldisericia bacterium]HOC79376.1 DivIVA domain-containing protein [Caldisericia bacterium]HOG70815.1 DivIVA domain-containing protein [Caldisericia bacterium]HPA66037.1 DivIVA domain-containing protein [Caldisericia bacterium]
MLVPLDIQHKTFKSAVSGYNKQEVHEFLAEVEKDFSQLYRENKELQEKLSKLTEEVSRYRATGTQLQQALTLAQKTADELKDSARRESELILADAKSKAEVVTNESKQSVRVIKNAYLEFKGEFRAYLTTFLNLLDNMDSSLVGKISVKDKEEEQPPQDQDNC